MLISYDHKFIFIHVYKVAGSSIKNALKLHSHDPDGLFINRLRKKLAIESEIPFHKYRKFPAHIKAKELKSELPSHIYNQYFKFTFVRNPWDWQVSLYHYMLQRSSHFQHDIVKNLVVFEDYIKWRVSQDKHLQKDFVVDDSGKQIVDFVGKYENLENDFQNVCNTLNIKASIPHINRSIHRDYKSYYNERTVKLIEDHFKEDIELFGYTF